MRNQYTPGVWQHQISLACALDGRESSKELTHRKIEKVPTFRVNSHSNLRVLRFPSDSHRRLDIRQVQKADLAISPLVKSYRAGETNVRLGETEQAGRQKYLPAESSKKTPKLVQLTPRRQEIRETPQGPEYKKLQMSCPLVPKSVEEVLLFHKIMKKVSQQYAKSTEGKGHRVTQSASSLLVQKSVVTPYKQYTRMDRLAMWPNKAELLSSRRT